jgi:hypothetical protein
MTTFCFGVYKVNEPMNLPKPKRYSRERKEAPTRLPNQLRIPFMKLTTAATIKIILFKEDAFYRL